MLKHSNLVKRRWRDARTPPAPKGPRILASDKVTGFSPVAAEALTKPDLATGYGSSGHPKQGKLSVTMTGSLA